MSLHWANDPVGQLIQCRRALRPDGLLLCIFPGGASYHELRTCLTEAETSCRGGVSPRVLPLADIKTLGGLLQRAGFALPVADSIDFTLEYDSLFHLARDLRAAGEQNALAARSKIASTKEIFKTADALMRQHFPGNTKAVRSTVELIVLTGWAPAATQPKPLRPGSATTRLADVLNTQEKPLTD